MLLWFTIPIVDLQFCENSACRCCCRTYIEFRTTLLVYSPPQCLISLSPWYPSAQQELSPRLLCTVILHLGSSYWTYKTSSTTSTSTSTSTRLPSTCGGVDCAAAGRQEVGGVSTQQSDEKFLIIFKTKINWKILADNFLEIENYWTLSPVVEEFY